MIIVTGGAGLIGSAIIWKLNQRNIKDILVVDQLRTDDRWKNLVPLNFADYINKNDLLCNLIQNKYKKISCIIHMGACSSTTEKDVDYLMNVNYEYSKKLFHYCLDNNIKFVYASSCATYGDGSNGYDDQDVYIEKYRPLNPYGYSKQLFDLYVRKTNAFENAIGLKFSNVFGCNELHKKDMMSMVCKSYFQIKETGKVQLFKSYNENYKDGQQLRDFVYVKDAANMVVDAVFKPHTSGLFNVGSGESHSWNQLVKYVFYALKKDVNIQYIDMPQNIKQHYQYYTQAKTNKLKWRNVQVKTTPFKDAIFDTIEYLEQNKRLGECLEK